MRKTLATVVGAVSAIAVLGGTAVAGASARPAASGTEHFQIMRTSATASSASIIGYGLFTQGGTSTGVSGSGSKSTVTFPNGTFVITHSGTSTQHFNPKTCLLQVSGTGTYTLGSGTGAYAHLSGSGTYKLSILAVGAKSGGTCSKTLPPTSFQQVISASGPATLS